MKTDEESRDAGFFPLDHLPAPIIRLNQRVIDQYQARFFPGRPESFDEVQMRKCQQAIA